MSDVKGGNTTVGKSAAPGSALLTRREIAEEYGVHLHTVTKWERQGMSPEVRGGDGTPSLWRRSGVHRWYAAREALLSVPTLRAARAEKERAQADIAREKFRALQRRLLPAAEARRAWSAECRSVAATLNAWTARIAPETLRAALKDGPSGIERLLADEVTAVLRELTALPREET